MSKVYAIGLNFMGNYINIKGKVNWVYRINILMLLHILMLPH